VHAFALYHSQPNPTVRRVQIGFDLPSESEVALTVFDATGRTVAQLIDRHMKAGRHQIGWDATTAAGNSVPAGVYFYRLDAGAFTETKKMLVIW
jgi:flagellar hook assembly protein FlgD